MAVTRRDIEEIYTALRPRLSNLGKGATVVVTQPTIPAHTHPASAITDDPTGDVASENVQDSIAELADEKLARSGAQTMLGALDMNHNSIANADDADIEGTATIGVDAGVGQDVTAGRDVGVGRDLGVARNEAFTGGVGYARITNPRKITMEGAESDGEARIEEINALAFNSIAPTAEVGKAAWDSTESTLCVFVASGASIVLVAAGWIVRLAANGTP